MSKKVYMIFNRFNDTYLSSCSRKIWFSQGHVSRVIDENIRPENEKDYEIHEFELTEPSREIPATIWQHQRTIKKIIG